MNKIALKPSNRILVAVFIIQMALCSRAFAQDSSSEPTAQQLERLTAAVSLAEEQLAASQQQIIELRRELDMLKDQSAHKQGADVQPNNGDPNPIQSQQGTPLTQSVEDIRERQAVQQSEIATHERSKVESESKYPVKITGLILLNGFNNSSMVNSPPTPTLALPGAGSSGASLSQTILGLDAHGPHLFGASSTADLRVDFNGTTEVNGYNNGIDLVRLRTAHAALSWQATELFFALDRPILNPNAPSSLTAVAEPALAWSGNLWSWNPQLGIQHDFRLSPSFRLRSQAALIDPVDPPGLASFIPPSVLTAPSGTERSRWPGVETRLALIKGDDDRAATFGIGGYFSPHRTPYQTSYDAWAATLDYRIPLPARFEWSGSVYRGLALGGLGAGAFKDYVFAADPGSNSTYVQPLDDVGGWTQLKQRITERVEWNMAYGIDNVFANQLRPLALPVYAPYWNLARNRTAYANIIYSPSAYLLFSFEYRRLESSPVISHTSAANIFGLAAAYKF